MNSLNVLSNYKKEFYFAKPFPHIEIDNALNNDIYKKLEDEYKIIVSYLKKNHKFENNIRLQVSSKKILEDSFFKKTIWYDFVKFHTSKEFFNQIVDIFERDIGFNYSTINIDKSKEILGIRSNELKNNKSNFVIDCQPGINTPVKQKSSVRGPHVDNPVELIGGLFYLKNDNDPTIGGDLNFFESSKKIYFKGKAEVDNEKDLNLIKTIKYTKNKCVFFLNTLKTLHSVTPRTEGTYTRNLINFVIENYNIKNGYFQMPRKGNLLKKILNIVS